jgi:hypothetical protein
MSASPTDAGEAVSFSVYSQRATSTSSSPAVRQSTPMRSTIAGSATSSRRSWRCAVIQ